MLVGVQSEALEVEKALACRGESEMVEAELAIEEGWKMYQPVSS